ncbi:MAG: hypothetical protein QOJ90_1523 [Actinomycetota bacterium]|nr:hypothetical protein [Actinomycetota bacterium]MDQ1642172.1 hypothetical protein [Actinomycetota bacterium]
MSRMTSIRKESRKSARRANAKMGPAAAEAREAALRYAESTRDWAAPKVEAAIDWAAPRVEPMTTRVKDDVMPKVASAVTAALVASEPAREEAKSRGTAAIAALRGEIEAPKPKKHRLRKLFLLAGVIGAAVAGWKAWMGQQDRQPEPWATPIGSAPSSAAGSTYSTPSSTSALGDDAAGASPDEALADSSEQASSDDNTVVDVTGVTTTEKVPPKAAKKAKSAAEASKTESGSA